MKKKLMIVSLSMVALAAGYPSQHVATFDQCLGLKSKCSCNGTGQYGCCSNLCGCEEGASTGACMNLL